MIAIFKKTNKQFVIALSVFIALLLLVIALRIFIGVIVQENAELQQTLRQETREDIVVLKRAIRAYEEHTEIFDTILVDKGSIFPFIDDLEILATQNGLRSSVVTVDLYDVDVSGERVAVDTSGETGESRSHGELDVTFQVTGDWDAVIAFLLQIENIPQQLFINTTRIAAVFDDQTGQQLWSATFNLSILTN